MPEFEFSNTMRLLCGEIAGDIWFKPVWEICIIMGDRLEPETLGLNMSMVFDILKEEMADSSLRLLKYDKYDDLSLRFF